MTSVRDYRGTTFSESSISFFVGLHYFMCTYSRLKSTYEPVKVYVDPLKIALIPDSKFVWPQRHAQVAIALQHYSSVQWFSFVTSYRR